MSCKGKTDANTTIPEEKLKWSEIVITLDHQRILIYNNSDSAYFFQWDFKKEFHHGKTDPSIVYKPTNSRDTTFIITKSERDSLAKYVYSLITKPVFTTKFVTDYVGNISFLLKSGGTSLSCEYNSVGNWTNTSGPTQKIYRLLSNKVNISSN
jgi:hypothetical protein